SETVVGRAIAGLDERPYIFTKGGQPEGPEGATLHDLTRDGLRRELEASLNRLGLDAVDLYQIHWPIPDEHTRDGWAGRGRAASAPPPPASPAPAASRGPRPSRRSNRRTRSSHVKSRTRSCPS